MIVEKIVMDKYLQWRNEYRKPDFSLAYDDMNDNENDFLNLFEKGELVAYFEERANNYKL